MAYGFVRQLIAWDGATLQISGRSCPPNFGALSNFGMPWNQDSGPECRSIPEDHWCSGSPWVDSGPACVLEQVSQASLARKPPACFALSAHLREI